MKRRRSTIHYVQYKTYSKIGIQNVQLYNHTKRIAVYTKCTVAAVMAYMYILYSILYIMYSSKKLSSMWKTGSWWRVRFVQCAIRYVQMHKLLGNDCMICISTTNIHVQGTVDRLAVFAPDCLYVFDECLVFVWRLFFCTKRTILAKFCLYLFAKGVFCEKIQQSANFSRQSPYIQKIIAARHRRTEWVGVRALSFGQTDGSPLPYRCKFAKIVKILLGKKYLHSPKNARYVHNVQSNKRLVMAYILYIQNVQSTV